jgi:[acyl-carrier-protein] S-malonyltransferase
MNTAFIFPGQGSQAIGMGKDLYDNFEVARNVFDRIDEALKQNLSKIIFEGPIEDLTSTQNTQPALMAVSMAFIEVIKSQSNKFCDIVAGHSVGEYSALVASGSISIEDAARILRIRGDAMQNSCEAGKGAMAACLGLHINKVEEIAKATNTKGICDIANDNTESQIVISGEVAAIDYACEMIKEAGGRAIKLNVSGPFHSRLMNGAENVMSKALQEVNLKAPIIPIILNVTASLANDIEEIRNSLIKQVSGRVRWRETIAYFANAGISNIIEIGSGKVLTGMLKKTEHSFKLQNVGNIQELEEFLSA